MIPFWRVFAVFAVVFCTGQLLAHEPDADVLEVSEVSVGGARPVASSSQQFIPDKEILLQPQGRPAGRGAL